MLQISLVGASEKAQREIAAQDFRPATAIVIGNEGEGLSPAVRDRCDALARIPQCGAIGSLNAAAAAAIFCYEARRQREISEGAHAKSQRSEGAQI